MTSLTQPALAAASAAAATHPRRLSPDVVRSGSLVRMLVAQARAELVKLLRAPDFVAPVVLLPIMLFALFGTQASGQTIDGVSLRPVIAASYVAFGVLGIVVFTFGEALAAERGQGWLRLMRTTPLPGSVFIAAKFITGMALVLLLVAGFIVATTALDAGITAESWPRLTAVALLGAAAIAPVGFVLGLVVRPSAAGAVALLLYLPLAFASGMWGPVDALPEVVQAVSPWLPTSHLAALAHGAVGLDTGPVLEHVAWLAATAVVGGAIAAVAYRRLAGRKFA